jgi:hypothetical protein
MSSILRCVTRGDVLHAPVHCYLRGLGITAAGAVVQAVYSQRQYTSVYL